MDTGAIIFSINFIESLYSLVVTEEKYKNIVNKNMGLNLYKKRKSTI